MRVSRKIFLLNIFTLSRIPLTIVFSIILMSYKCPFLRCLALFFLIGLTDYFDGRIARKYKLETILGAKLDILTDFFFIAVSLLTLIYVKAFPSWMLIIIVAKFVEFLATSFKKKKYSEDRDFFLFDKLGRIVAVLFYILPIFTVYLICYDLKYNNFILQMVCIGITILGFISSMLRLNYIKLYE
ncbi:MAG: CDP-alcohol phosphatidyltransferase family protein [Filifactoraceae bacterium]